MSLALIGAVLIDESTEALILLILFTLSEAIEGTPVPARAKS